MSPALTRLLAFTGDAEAREALGWWPLKFTGPNHVPGDPFQSDSDWVTGLVPLVKAATERECGECENGAVIIGGPDHWGSLPCPACDGTGKIIVPTMPLLRLAIACGRAAWNKALSSSVCEPADDCEACSAFAALTAAAAYVEEPTEERREALVAACRGDLPLWAKLNLVGRDPLRAMDLIRAAAALIDVRAACLEEVKTWS